MIPYGFLSNETTYAHRKRLLAAMVRVRVPRGTDPRTNGSRRCPTWDRRSSQWFAPVSHAGQARVPMVRVRVPRGTGARTNGSRRCPTRDGRAYQWFASVSHAGQAHV